MTDPKDIIELVKELQGMHKTRESMRGHGLENSAEAAIYYNFPRIAESLLIAVEALEKIETEVMDSAAEHAAEDALTRIRSL